ncbi:hypothetical protein C9374_003713 [Naegleria lovaniensis]|uniref:Receptor ligand binding region domain-containing protein n=1 Tax=Naegleria lovaniensis TaxID=51637 RepID=A0AA88H5R8_NAELO|nr:uncharacterized protein C9374_003713 [Naegleria lovaniensis]KAG2393949.1 hypothetical protein C9374_003713 [Naegleria lovaniensis]
MDLLTLGMSEPNHHHGRITHCSLSCTCITPQQFNTSHPRLRRQAHKQYIAVSLKHYTSLFIALIVLLFYIFLSCPMCSAQSFDCTGRTFKFVSVIPDEDDATKPFSGDKLKTSISSGLEFMKIAGIIPPGVTIQNDFVVTRGNVDQAIDRMKQLILVNGTVEEGYVGIIGGYYSYESLAIANNIAEPFGIPMISYGSSTSTLSYNRWFYRVIPSSFSMTAAMVEFFYSLEFNEIAILASDEVYGRDASENVIRNANSLGLNVTNAYYFKTGNITDIKRQIYLAKESNTKKFVCVSVSSNGDADAVIQTIHEAGMAQLGYIWIFDESFAYQPGLSDKNITLSVLLNGMMYVELNSGLWSTDLYFITRFMSTYKYSTIEETYSQIQAFDRFAYDSALSFGYAIRTMCKAGLDPTKGSYLLATIQRTSFIGASGRVSFDSLGDRLGVFYSINSISDHDVKSVAKWSQLDSIVWDEEFFYNRTLRVPGGYLNQVQIFSNSPLTGNRWFSIPNVARVPPERFAHALALASNKLYVYGGNSQLSTGYFSDLWSYDFITGQWHRTDPLDGFSPKGRHGHVMWTISATQTSEEKLVIFGGRSASYSDEMYEFSILRSQWKLLNITNKPFARFDARISEYKNEVYMFGGLTYSGVRDDLWIFNNDRYEWRKVTYTTPWPPARYAHCMQPYVVNGKTNILLFGGMGENGEVLADLWSFNIASQTWTLLNQTGEVQGPIFDMGCATTDKYLYVFHGKTSRLNQQSLFKKIIRVDLPLNSNTVRWKVINDNLPNPRSNSQVVSFSNYIIYFGGFGLDYDFNDLYSFNVLSTSLVKVNRDFRSPPSLYAHSMSTLGDSVYLFGGFTSDDTASDALYRYSISKEGWTFVDTSIRPHARAFHSQITLGDRIWVFGGSDSTAKSYSDLWTYSIDDTVWTLVTPTKGSLSPGPRYKHAMTKNTTHLFVFGGRTQSNQYTDLWTYEAESKMWTKIKTQIPTSYTIGCTAKFYDESETGSFQTILLFGCHDFSETPTTNIYKLEFTDKNNDMVKYSIAGNFSNGSILPRSGSIAIKVSGFGAIIFGGRVGSELHNDVLLFDAKTKSLTKIDPPYTEHTLPQPRVYHSYSLVGNSIYVFGGVGSPYGTRYLLPSIRYGDLYKYNVENVCDDKGYQQGSTRCYLCGPGTYQVNKACELCPPGTYYEKFGASGQCMDCPKGFFNSLSGANHIQFCLPCAYGTYNNFTGQAKCLPCPEGSICQLGSIEPIFNNSRIVKRTSQQPVSYSSREMENSQVIKIEASVLASITAAIILIAFIAWRVFNFPRTEWLKRMDFFFTERHNRLMGTMIKRRTIVGACYSFVVLVAFLAYLIGTIVPYYNYGNYVENRSLIPNLAVSEEFYGDISVEVRILGFKGDCTFGSTLSTIPTKCQDKISIVMESVDMFNDTITSITCRDELSENEISACVIAVSCSKCTIAKDKKLAALHFKVGGPNVFSNGYDFLVNVSSAYVDVYAPQKPPQRSIITGSVFSEVDQLYRGTTNPTVVSLQLLQNKYTIPIDNTKRTGYVIEYTSETQGDQVDFKTFSHENGVYLKIEFEKASTTLEVVLSEKKIVLVFLTDLLASLSGIFSLTALCMSCTEFVIFHYKRIMTNLISFRQKHSVKRYAPGEILDEVILQGTTFKRMKADLKAQDDDFYDDVTVAKIYHKKGTRRNVVFIPPNALEDEELIESNNAARISSQPPSAETYFDMSEQYEPPLPLNITGTNVVLTSTTSASTLRRKDSTLNEPFLAKQPGSDDILELEDHMAPLTPYYRSEQ